jgi:hypothetical protein
MTGEDKPLSKCLIYQTELISALKDKGLYYCDDNIMFQSRKSLKSHKLQEHYIKISKYHNKI